MAPHRKNMTIPNISGMAFIDILAGQLAMRTTSMSTMWWTRGALWGGPDGPPPCRRQSARSCATGIARPGAALALVRHACLDGGIRLDLQSPRVRESGG